MEGGTAKPTRSFRIETAGRVSRPATAAAGVILLMLVLLPLFAGRSLIQDLIFLFYMLALAQCWNLLAGYAGLISVGQQAFVGLGGYLLFALTLLGGINPLLAIPIAGHRLGGAGPADRLDRVPATRRLFRDRHLGRGRGLSSGLRPVQGARRRHRDVAFAVGHLERAGHRMDQDHARRAHARRARHRLLLDGAGADGRHAGPGLSHPSLAPRPCARRDPRPRSRSRRASASTSTASRSRSMSQPPP